MQRMESVFATVLLATAAASCASGRATQTGTLTMSIRGPVEMPGTVGAFRQIVARPVQGAPGDTNFRFDNGAGMGISVFRYAIPADVQVDDDTLAWIRREGQKFPVVQRILVSRGVADSMKVRIGTLNPPRPAFPLAEYIGVVQTWSARRGVMIESEYIYVVGGRFLKIRGSEPDVVGGPSPVAQFARDLLGSLLQASAP